MLTALLLLLGLSGAGAGLYSVLKEPKNQAEGDRAVSNTASGSAPANTSSESTHRQRSSSGSPKQGSPSQKPSPSYGDFPESEPENLPLGDYGGEANESNDFSQMAGSPSVSYSADDIISKNSKYSHHRRPLINAENLVEKEKIDEALEIYKRTEARIPDAEIKEKINQNINDLKGFKKQKEKLDDYYDGGSDNFDEPLREKIDSLQKGMPIPIRDLAEAIREIAEALAESLSKGFYPAGNIPQQPPVTPPVAPTTAPQVGMPQDPSGYERKLPPDYFPQPIVYQIVSAPGAPLEAKHQIPPPSAPPQYQPAPPPPPLDPGVEDSDMPFKDLPDDTFFSRDWDKFKDLPLTDRRSGKERRLKKDRRSNLDRKDRRSGEDRRKIDLFKEREEYLKKKAEEKKAFQEGLPTQEPPLSDQLSPFYPPYELPEIGLPEPEPVSTDSKIFKLTPESVELEEIGLPSGELARLDLGSGKDLPTPIDFQRDPSSKNELELPNPEDISRGAEPNPPEWDPPKWEVPPIEIPPPEIGEKTKEDLPSIGLPEAEEMRREMGADGPVLKPPVSGDVEDALEDLEDRDAPDVEIVDGDLEDQLGEIESPEEDVEEEQEPEKILHGVLELKPPEVDDAPFLTLTYDFSKIPHGFRLSKNYSIMEYSYYKYKPMLMKAQEFARRKMLKNALNYYRVIKSQNIPPEMRKMINRNIQDITEFMEKFLMAKGG